jgi:O-acetyl-ADP-ribose deacetylase (regulator of RNase III)
MTSQEICPSALVRVKGDLLEARQQVIVHQINCLCTRPHGLAASIAARFPYANVYGQRRPVGCRNFAVEADRGTPGDIAVRTPDFTKGEQGPTVVGLYGQYDYGKAGRSHRTPAHLDTRELRLQWFVASLEKLADHMAQHGLTSVAFPHGIGCGLAGGSWTMYQSVLESWAGRHRDLNVCLYQL